MPDSNLKKGKPLYAKILKVMAVYAWRHPWWALGLTVFAVLGLLDALIFGRFEILRGLWATLALAGGQFMLVRWGILKPLFQAGRVVVRGQLSLAAVAAFAVGVAAVGLESRLIILVITTGSVGDMSPQATIDAYSWHEWFSVTTILAVQSLPMLAHRLSQQVVADVLVPALVAWRFNRHVSRFSWRFPAWQPALVPA